MAAPRPRGGRECRSAALPIPNAESSATNGLQLAVSNLTLAPVIFRSDMLFVRASEKRRGGLGYHGDWVLFINPTSAYML
jgi:hypothetical protein